MSAAPEASNKALVARPGIGLTACVVQRSELRFSRIAIDRPALILVRHGTKILQSPRGEWVIRAGEAVALAGGQSFDVTNRISSRGLYEARWLVWDASVLERFVRATPEQPPLAGAVSLGRVNATFTGAFDRALEAVGDVRHVPAGIAAHRLSEILLWLSLQGIRFPVAENLTLAARVRRLVESALADDWPASEVARRLSLSEATLRRHLAKEGATLGDLLTDIRMSYALLLLQSTDQAVNRIALDVGYESASRFAIRFRERFGIPPSAIRGHERPRAIAAASAPRY